MMIIRGLSLIIFFSATMSAAKSYKSYPLELDPLTYPENCLNQHESSCTLTTKKNKKFRWEWQDSSLVLGGETTVTRSESDVGSVHKVDLIKGVIYVNTYSPFIIQLEFGQVKANSGRFIIQRRVNSATIISIDAQLNIYPKGGESAKPLLPTRQIELSAVGEGGQSVLGVTRAADIYKLLNLWSSLYLGPKKQFREEVLQVKNTWSQSVLALSEQYELKVKQNRFIASERKRRHQEYLRKKQQDEEEMLELFRKKNYISNED